MQVPGGLDKRLAKGIKWEWIYPEAIEKADLAGICDGLAVQGDAGRRVRVEFLSALGSQVHSVRQRTQEGRTGDKMIRLV